MDTIVIRTVTAPDDAVLERLATIDGARPLFVPALVAEVEGAGWAAISLIDGRAVADPFCRTADMVALLRTAAERHLPAR